MITGPDDEGTAAQAAAETLDALLSGARAGDGRASRRLGDLYLEGEMVARDVDEAFRWYSLGASQGDAVAQSNLGLMFLHGTGCRADEARAASWFRRSAEQGHAAGQHNLGRRYLLGEGVAPDMTEAARWFAAAAAQGDLDSTYELAVMFRFGRGVDRDIAVAASLYLVVAQRGAVAAEAALAECLEELQDAALAGSQSASRCLCVMHNVGLGVPASAPLTWTWIRWAKEQCRPAADGSGTDDIDEAYDFHRHWLRDEDRLEGERVLAALLRPVPRAPRARPLPRVRYKRRRASGGEQESA